MACMRFDCPEYQWAFIIFHTQLWENCGRAEKASLLYCEVVLILQWPSYTCLTKSTSVTRLLPCTNRVWNLYNHCYQNTRCTTPPTQASMYIHSKLSFIQVSRSTPHVFHSEVQSSGCFSNNMTKKSTPLVGHLKSHFLSFFQPSNAFCFCFISSALCALLLLQCVYFQAFSFLFLFYTFAFLTSHQSYFHLLWESYFCTDGALQPHWTPPVDAKIILFYPSI